MCLCVAVYPGAVSLQHSLIHSISLFVGARACGGRRRGKRGLEGNYWHFLLLSNWPSALPWGGPTAILHQLRRTEKTRHTHTYTNTHTPNNLSEGLGMQFSLFQGNLQLNCEETLISNCVVDNVAVLWGRVRLFHQYQEYAERRSMLSFSSSRSPITPA